jgi:quercetin dioxygenase-like cupin family protein
MTAHGIVRRPTEAEEGLRILLAARENHHAAGVVEMAFPVASGGPPLHVHPTHGEGFYVLDGEMTFQLGEVIVTADAGTWAFAPRDTPHTLANLGAADARLLCVFAPGGFERRFERMLADPARRGALADLADAEAATRILGPPRWTETS